MSDPVRLQISKAIQTNLQAISRASGFHNTVAATSVVLDAESLLTVDPSATPFMVLDDWEPVERLFMTSRPVQIHEKARTQIMAAIDAPATDKAAKTTAFENFVADVEKALAGSIGKYTLSGLVEIVLVQQPLKPGMGLPNQSRVIVVIPIEVQWNRQYGTP